MIKNGVPKQREDMSPGTQQFWYIRDRLSPDGNLVMFENRVVIPKALQSKILKDLHSAHQGSNSMIMRANQSIYWPGMTAAIKNTRYTCRHCNEAAPSLTKEPYTASPPPIYPFQRICMDYFTVGHHSYLVCVDRFST